MSFAANIYGLDELLSSDIINPKRITASVKRDIGIATLELHKALVKSVYNKFTGNNNLRTQLVGKSKDVEVFGKNVIRGGLTYKIKYADLSKFGYSAEWGNIHAGARRKGLVHATNVTRGGGRQTIHGRSSRGGFMPRTGQRLNASVGRPMRFNGHGTQMYERTGSEKMPVRLLLGPSTSMQIHWALKNSPAVRSIVDSLENKILNDYF